MRSRELRRPASAVLALIMACGALLLAGCSSAAKLEAYEIGNDSVASVNSVVGTRKVSGVSTGKSNGATYKQYTYESGTVTQDLASYLLKNLAKNGWTPTVDFNLEQIPGKAQLATKSSEEGKILLMDVDYKDTGYTIKLTQTKGTLKSK
ncbi:MAG: hypothetical protein SOH99_11850 [Acidipropionibacterium acidipropionici]|uniref:Lipoprotein n=1 Tax=Acidipropionibacterium acidipropionici (strain ATCC 4875 / DSM 20272 / JCM 6432 / NBRC 12425 / NCIMB 8070 / 4) TaxID=1171373 RepID=K7S3K8_ACIA4|nr:hypothetical protein [Acidipropionibacterium acidipropionici]AFV89182.1 hypothetical protein PACID_13640 [Acidipropionibacterium acidipropionici ATCC 4875]ALN16254.1 hypothetical protein ASQ49_14395 [Acidipropionibacterium acidipropionici]AZP38300.1 hypothetical protein DUY81_11275 [Acidipropionibacterium acidipropionici]MDN6556221.1 hypothetical protein [Acidipropionibacterium acidipropionici]QCV95289.1 hypothetical protein FEZ30_08455 [Acidipropionibacterium acidipropionici]